MSDKLRVLQHLQERGSITPLEAMDGFGCYRLGARIWDLRRDGHDIVTEIVQDVDRNGEPMRYARYTLKGDRNDRSEMGEGL